MQWKATHSSGEPYFLMNSAWNLLRRSQTAPMSFSDGRKVVRKWNVPSTCNVEIPVSTGGLCLWGGGGED